MNLRTTFLLILIWFTILYVLPIATSIGFYERIVWGQNRARDKSIRYSSNEFGESLELISTFFKDKEVYYVPSVIDPNIIWPLKTSRPLSTCGMISSNDRIIKFVSLESPIKSFSISTKSWTITSIELICTFRLHDRFAHTNLKIIFLK